MDYFLSSLSAGLLDVLARDFMWMRTLSSTPMLESETRNRLPDRLRGIAAKIGALETSVASANSLGRVAGTGFSADLRRGGGGGGGGGAGRPKDLVDIATSRYVADMLCITRYEGG